MYSKSGRACNEKEFDLEVERGLPSWSIASENGEETGTFRLQLAGEVFE